MPGKVLISSLFAVMFATSALAQGHSHSSSPAVATSPAPSIGGAHGAHGAAKPGSSKAETEATKAYRLANDQMHKKMDIAYSSDADVDFVKGMIPHHEGALDMAKAVLAHGKDAEIRKLAVHIIKEQESEIFTMRQWLKAKGH